MTDQRTAGPRSTAWWGMVMLIATEATIFAGLLASYFFLRAGAKEWPLGGIEPPELGRSSIFTVVLLSSSLPVFWAESGIRRGRQGRLRVGLLLAFVMGAAFLAHTLLEFEEHHFGWRDNAYGSIFYATVGLHALHVFVGLAMNAVVQLKAWMGKFSSDRHATVEVFGLYWHFVDGVWIFVFSSLFLSAHLG